jgi:hypothetical protein
MRIACTWDKKKTVVCYKIVIWSLANNTFKWIDMMFVVHRDLSRWRSYHLFCLDVLTLTKNLNEQ